MSLSLLTSLIPLIWGMRHTSIYVSMWTIYTCANIWTASIYVIVSTHISDAADLGHEAHVSRLGEVKLHSGGVITATGYQDACTEKTLKEDVKKF